MFTILLFSNVGNAGIVITLNVGQLLQLNGTTPVADGALIQILANTSGTGVPIFDAPTTTSFTGTSGDNIVVANFTLDSSTVGTSGDFKVELSTSASGSQLPLNLTGVSQGDDLLLRWFPTLTTASTQPGLGTSYGQFRTDGKPDGSNITWSIPLDSSTPYTLSFLTMSQNGSQLNSLGIADLRAIPEPSTFVLFGIFALGLLGFLYRRRRVIG